MRCRSAVKQAYAGEDAQCCTPAGSVVHHRYLKLMPSEILQEKFELVSGGK
jgi:hypothetical protein